MSEAGHGLAPEILDADARGLVEAAPGQRTRRIALVLFAAWVLAFVAVLTAEAVQTLRRGERPVNHYALSYTVVFGGLVLALRGPVARRLRRAPIPVAVSFFALSLIACCVEEALCYVTGSGMWEKTDRFHPEYILGVSALMGWSFGVYASGRFLRLGVLELLFVTGFAGWFQELMVFRPLAVLQSPGIALAALAWVIWSYAILVLIPTALVPGPDALPAAGGRWWRYPAAFVFSVAGTLTVAAAAAVVVGEAGGS